MPIEFRCVQCGKLLRTGDGTAGRQAQCPVCGSLSTVPGVAEAEPLAPPSPPPEPAPGMSPGQAFQLAASRVSAPATALIVIAVLSMVLRGLSIIVDLLFMPMQPPGGQFPGIIPVQINWQVDVAANIFGLATGALVLLGAIKMKKLENYALAMTAAIVALVPCTSPCCLLGFPFGLWAIVVLSDSSVKTAFRS